MVRIRNVGNGPVVVGEKYLYPGESRLVNREHAAAAIAQNPDRLTGQPVKEQPFADGQGATGGADGVLLTDVPPTQKDNLRAIRGIGARTVEALAVLGVDSYAALISADVDELAAALDGSSVTQVTRWQEQARQLLSRLDE